MYVSRDPNKRLCKHNKPTTDLTLHMIQIAATHLRCLLLPAYQREVKSSLLPSTMRRQQPNHEQRVRHEAQYKYPIYYLVFIVFM